MTEDRRQRTDFRFRIADCRLQKIRNLQSEIRNQCRHPSSVIRFQGFSLIELLVVISIISALLALLIPGLGRAKNLAKRTQCASNLHQIDIAMHLYVNSNDDKYPAAQDPLPKKQPTDPNIWLWMGRGFRGFISPYLGGHIDANQPSVFLCTVDKAAPLKYESTSYSYSMAFYHSPEQINEMNNVQYTYNTGLIYPCVPQKSVDVRRPAEKIIIGEWYSNHYQIKAGTDPGWWGLAGKRNYLFVDGQVRFLHATELRTANDGNPNPNLTKDGIRGIDWPK